MNKKIGFIGSGNMGQAMIKGLVESDLINNENILVFDKNKELAKSLADENKLTNYENIEDIAKDSNILVLAVKPYNYEEVLNDIQGNVSEDTVVVVIAVGISFEDISNKLGNVKIVRAQPSTPALVGESNSTLLPNERMNEQDLEEIIEIFNSFGKTEVLPENLMDVVPSIASSAPAYALMLISAMADGGCLEGFPRDQALRLSAQSVLGAAKMVLETGEHPDVLKDKICTPGGTTIEAVCKLEEKGFRNAVIEAVKACAQKSKDMMKK